MCKDNEPRRSLGDILPRAVELKQQGVSNIDIARKCGLTVSFLEKLFFKVDGFTRCNLCGEVIASSPGPSLCDTCKPVACEECHGMDCPTCGWQGRKREDIPKNT